MYVSPCCCACTCCFAAGAAAPRPPAPVSFSSHCSSSSYRTRSSSSSSSRTRTSSSSSRCAGFVWPAETPGGNRGLAAADSAAGIKTRHLTGTEKSFELYMAWQRQYRMYEPPLQQQREPREQQHLQQQQQQQQRNHNRDFKRGPRGPLELSGAPCCHRQAAAATADRRPAASPIWGVWTAHWGPKPSSSWSAAAAAERVAAAAGAASSKWRVSYYCSSTCCCSPPSVSWIHCYEKGCC